MIENCWSALMIVTNKTQSIHLPKSLLSLQTTFHLYLFQQKKNAIKTNWLLFIATAQP